MHGLLSKPPAALPVSSSRVQSGRSACLLTQCACSRKGIPSQRVPGTSKTDIHFYRSRVARCPQRSYHYAIRHLARRNAVIPRGAPARKELPRTRQGAESRGQQTRVPNGSYHKFRESIYVQACTTYGSIPAMNQKDSPRLCRPASREGASDTTSPARGAGAGSERESDRGEANIAMHLGIALFPREL